MRCVRDGLRLVGPIKLVVAGLETLVEKKLVVFVRKSLQVWCSFRVIAEDAVAPSGSRRRCVGGDIFPPHVGDADDMVATLAIDSSCSPSPCRCRMSYPGAVPRSQNEMDVAP